MTALNIRRATGALLARVTELEGELATWIPLEGRRPEMAILDDLMGARGALKTAENRLHSRQRRTN